MFLLLWHLWGSWLEAAADLERPLGRGDSGCPWVLPKTLYCPLGFILPSSHPLSSRCPPPQSPLCADWPEMLTAEGHHKGTPSALPAARPESAGPPPSPCPPPGNLRLKYQSLPPSPSLCSRSVPTLYPSLVGLVITVLRRGGCLVSTWPCAASDTPTLLAGRPWELVTQELSDWCTEGPGRAWVWPQALPALSQIYIPWVPCVALCCGHGPWASPPYCSVGLRGLSAYQPLAPDCQTVPRAPANCAWGLSQHRKG